jgi:hypothetical protein
MDTYRQQFCLDAKTPSSYMPFDSSAGPFAADGLAGQTSAAKAADGGVSKSPCVLASASPGAVSTTRSETVFKSPAQRSST